MKTKVRLFPEDMVSEIELAVTLFAGEFRFGDENSILAWPPVRKHAPVGIRVWSDEAELADTARNRMAKCGKIPTCLKMVDDDDVCRVQHGF